LAEIVVLLVFQDGPGVEPPRLDHQFEENFKSPEALLDRLELAIAARVNPVSALLDATQQSPNEFNSFYKIKTNNSINSK
jgi:hypothetical protein